jgi:hypothetical protein
MRGLFCLLAAAVALAASSSHAHAQSPDDVAMAKRFVGTWRLVSWTERHADGTTQQNPGDGYVIYTDNSRMCTVVMNPNRPKWKSAIMPTPDEAVSGIGSATDFTAYCSTVEVHAKDGFVLHHYEASKSPNAVGRTGKRWFTFDGQNRLTLRVDTTELPSPIAEWTLVWERVEKSGDPRVNR